MTKLFFDKENEKRPYLAVNAVILKKIKGREHILLGKRKNIAGAGHYYPPGGHVKLGEALHKTLIREIKEECGLQVKPGKLVFIEEAFKPNHHVIIYYQAFITGKGQEPITVEPEKCEGWQWFPIDQPPSPLWHSLGGLLEILK